MLKISVIIPVFNTEKYLNQCLDSVIDQTYKNLEIICIDDHSCDNSYKILEEYKTKDSRIKVFSNKETLSAGCTRNIGIRQATGDYIHFLDSDDWLEKDAYQKLVSILEPEANIDILAFQLNHTSLDGKKIIKTRKHSNPSQLNKILNINNTPELAQSWETFNAPKMYRKDFLVQNDCYYLNYKQGEDIHFCYLTLLKANNIYIIDEALYNYRCNNPKSLSAILVRNHDCAKRVFLDICALSENHASEVRKVVCSKVFYYYFWGLWKNFKNNKISYEYVKNSLIALEKENPNFPFKTFSWYFYIDEIKRKPFLYVYIKNSIRQLLIEKFPYLKIFITLIKKIRNNCKFL